MPMIAMGSKPALRGKSVFMLREESRKKENVHKLLSQWVEMSVAMIE